MDGGKYYKVEEIAVVKWIKEDKAKGTVLVDAKKF